MISFGGKVLFSLVVQFQEKGHFWNHFSELVVGACCLRGSHVCICHLRLCCNRQQIWRQLNGLADRNGRRKRAPGTASGGDPKPGVQWAQLMRLRRDDVSLRLESFHVLEAALYPRESVGAAAEEIASEIINQHLN